MFKLSSPIFTSGTKTSLLMLTSLLGLALHSLGWRYVFDSVNIVSDPPRIKKIKDSKLWIIMKTWKSSYKTPIRQIDHAAQFWLQYTTHWSCNTKIIEHTNQTEDQFQSKRTSVIEVNNLHSSLWKLNFHILVSNLWRELDSQDHDRHVHANIQDHRTRLSFNLLQQNRWKNYAIIQWKWSRLHIEIHG